MKNFYQRGLNRQTLWRVDMKKTFLRGRAELSVAFEMIDRLLEEESA